MNLPNIVHKKIAGFLPTKKSSNADIYFFKHSGCLEGTHSCNTKCNICDTIVDPPNTKCYLFFLKNGNQYIYSKYIEKVKIIIQKINDNIFDSKYSFLWEHHNNFDELWGRLTQNIRLTNDRKLKINKLDIEKLPSNHIFFQLHEKSPIVDRCYQLYEICNVRWQGMHYFFADIRFSDEMKEFKYNNTDFPVFSSNKNIFEIKGVKKNSLLIHEKILGPFIKNQLCSVNKIYNTYTTIKQKKNKKININ